MIPQETDPDLTMCVQESLADVWVDAGSGALSATVCGWDLLKEVTVIFITSTMFALRSTTGKEHPPDHQKKIGFKIY